MLKQVRTSLFESAREYFEAQIKEVVAVGIVSIHSDVSTPHRREDYRHYARRGFGKNLFEIIIYDRKDTKRIHGFSWKTEGRVVKPVTK